MRNHSLRVVIDGGLLGKPRGLGRYVKELLFALSEVIPPDINLHVLVGSATPSRHLIRSDRLHYHRLPSVPIPVWEQMIVPTAALWLKADLLHSPGNTKPLILNWTSLPHLVTVHDLIFLRSIGSTWYQKIGALYRRFVVSSMFHGRFRIVTDSSASAIDIEREFGYSPDVVALSVALFLQSHQKRSNVVCTPRSDYFVHIGGTAPHKNTRRVIDAFKTAALARHTLVVLGVPKESELSREHGSEEVIFPGWVSDEQVIDFIVGATAMVFPSLHEGYGLPIAEAFALGCPVITSNLAPMNEVAGGAALLVDPYSADALVQACVAIAEEAFLRKKLIDAGYERMTEFSALVMGNKMIDIYRRMTAA